MNGAHLHLLINHTPVIGFPIVALLLAIAYFRKSQELIRVSLWLLVLMVVAGAATFLTGEGAEDVIKRLPDFPDALFERHEALATASLVGAAILGVCTLVALFKARGAAIPRWVAAALLAGTVAASGVLAFTALAGGRIRHPEARSDFTLPPQDLQHTPPRN